MSLSLGLVTHRLSLHHHLHHHGFLTPGKSILSCEAESNRQKKYFGFALPVGDGQLDYFKFTVMAYGYSPAVEVVTRLLKPVNAHHICISLVSRFSFL
jgi:hypothetical protein